MTAEEIRASESGEANFGNESAYWLREIAAQLAELNENLARIKRTSVTFYEKQK